MNGTVELWIVPPGSGANGSKAPFVTLSSGIAECRNQLEMKQVFNTADQEALRSKNADRDRIRAGASDNRRFCHAP